MINEAPPLWLFWAYKIQALAQTGNNYEFPSALSAERTLPRHIRDAYAAQGDPALPSMFD